VDPASDLVPIYANCYRIAHRRKTIVTPMGELKALIGEASG
jgi:predicted HNH restriction endonuclease